MIFPYLEFLFAFFKVFHDISSPWAPCFEPTIWQVVWPILRGVDAGSRKTVLRQRIDDGIHRHLRTTVRPSSSPVGTQLPSASRNDWGLRKTRRLCQGAWGPPAHRPLRLCTLHLVKSGIWTVPAWLVYNHIVRTNNNCEGWHRRINNWMLENINFYLLVWSIFEAQVELVREMRLTRGQKCTCSQLDRSDDAIV